MSAAAARAIAVDARGDFVAPAVFPAFGRGGAAGKLFGDALDAGEGGGAWHVGSICRFEIQAWACVRGARLRTGRVHARLALRHNGGGFGDGGGELLFAVVPGFGIDEDGGAAAGGFVVIQIGRRELIGQTIAGEIARARVAG